MTSEDDGTDDYEPAEPPAGAAQAPWWHTSPG